VSAPRPATSGDADPDGAGGTAPDDAAPLVVTAALVIGIVAVVSAWTGWAGLGLGLLAVAVALAALSRVRAGRVPGPHPRRRPRIGLALGIVAVAIAAAVEATTLANGVTYLDTGGVRTLDECMRQAQNEKEQHVCKSQHLDEYRARYPGGLDP
jgi:hypothetical protein